MTKPSEVAITLASLVSVMPERAARDLQRLLVAKLGSVDPSTLRGRRLGLLIEMLDGLGTFPQSSDYDAERSARAAAGELWPDHGTLCRSYGSWLAAVDAAMKHLHSTGRPVSYRKPSTSNGYTLLETASALRRCRADLGLWSSENDWPTESEYNRYRLLCREQAARAGQPTPPLPGTKTIRKKCGSWERAIAQAKVERLDGAGNAASSPCRASRAPAPSAGSLGKAPRT